MSAHGALGVLTGFSALALFISTYPDGTRAYKIGWRVVSGLFILPVFIVACRAIL